MYSNEPTTEKTPRELRIDYEIKDIKKHSDKIGLMLLLIFGMSLLTSGLISLIFLILKTDKSSIEYAFMSKILNIGAYIAMFILPIALGLTEYKSNIKTLLKKPDTENHLSLYLFLFGAFACVTCNVYINVIKLSLSNIGITVTESSQPHIDNVGFLVLSIIGAIVLPAVFEEFLFRGLILTPLLKYGDIFAILISSFAFAIMHKNLLQLPFAFIVGLTLGFIRIKTNSLAIPICVHGLNNVISLIFDAINRTDNALLLKLSFLIYVALFSILGLCVVYYLAKYNRRIFAINRGRTLVSFKRSLTAVISSPVIILSILGAVGIIIVNFMASQKMI